MKELCDQLGIEPTEPLEDIPLNEMVEVHIPEDSKEVDFQTVRETKYKMMAVGEKTLAGALTMLRENPSPRGVEVITSLLKTMSDISDSLQTIRKEEKGTSEKEVAGHSSTTPASLSEILNQSKQ